MSRVVVIGAGVAGPRDRGPARTGRARGRRLEKNDRVGGRAGTMERDGFRFDSGPSWYLMPEVFEHFFAMMGTTTEEQLDLTRLDPGYRVFREPTAEDPTRGAVTVPAGRQAVTRLFEDLEPGSAPALDSYLQSARHAGEMAQKYFLYNPFTRTLVAPGAGGPSSAAPSVHAALHPAASPSRLVVSGIRSCVRSSATRRCFSAQTLAALPRCTT